MNIDWFNDRDGKTLKAIYKSLYCSYSFMRQGEKKDFNFSGRVIVVI